jgi:hypothetical protein
MNFPSKNDLGLIFYGGPLAIIILKKNLCIPKKMNLIREYFINEYGIYKIDPEMQYHHGKQAIFIYNSHEEKINLKTVKEIYKLFYKKKFEQVLEILYQLYPEDNPVEYEVSKEEIYKKFDTIIKKTQHYPIDIDTDKYLPQFIAHKPKATKLLMEIPNEAMKEIDIMYPPAIKPLPIIAVMIGILVFAIVWPDLPSYYQSLKDTIGGLIK